MVKLIARTPAQDALPVSVGALTLSEGAPKSITQVAAFPGEEKAATDALKAAIGVGLPKPNRSAGKGGARVLWFGPNEALVVGEAIEIPNAAVTDQTDGWCCLTLEGDGVTEVLARIAPLDLRESKFKRGHVARSLLGHMTCLFHKSGTSKFELYVFRSMAQTAIHELTRAMKSVSAQSGL